MLGLARMKRIAPSLILFGILGSAAAAHAQVPNSCSGELAGSLGLAVRDPQGQVHSLPQSTHFLGGAECQCGSQDLLLQVKLVRGRESRA